MMVSDRAFSYLVPAIVPMGITRNNDQEAWIVPTKDGAMIFYDSESNYDWRISLEKAADYKDRLPPVVHHPRFFDAK